MTLYLGIPPKSGIDWGNFNWYKIRRDLIAWLGSCCSEHAKTRVYTTNQRQKMSDYDGLVYLVGHRSDGVVARVGAAASPNLALGQTTIYNGGIISEVYINPLSTYGIAATIYHELLHNKLTDFGYSSRVHAAGGNFTTATAPYSTGGPDEIDQKLMCEALSSRSKQYQGGFDL